MQICDKMQISIIRFRHLLKICLISFIYCILVFYKLRAMLLRRLRIIPLPSIEKQNIKLIKILKSGIILNKFNPCQSRILDKKLSHNKLCKIFVVL